jgi:hypothetical protein
MQTQTYHLRLYEEVVGTLFSVDLEDGILTAKVGKIVVYLPAEMETAFVPLIGRKIGILRCDGGYRSRDIDRN